MLLLFLLEILRQFYISNKLNTINNDNMILSMYSESQRMKNHYIFLYTYGILFVCYYSSVIAIGVIIYHYNVTN